MALNLHLVRLFVTVAAEHSFSRSAEILNISQPAVSKGVLALERQLGLTLLDRSQPQLPLTEAGRILYIHAQALFANERQAEAALNQMRGLAQGRLIIGASTTIGNYLLPPLVSAFHHEYPDIHLSLVISNTNELVRQLLERPLDLAVVEGPVDATGVDLIPWQHDQLVVIAPPHHDSGKAQHVPLAALDHELFLLRETGSATRAVIDAHLLKRDITLPATMEVGNNEAIKQMVMAGVGLGLVPEATCAAEVAAHRLARLHVAELTIPRQFWRLDVPGRPRSPAAQAFTALLDHARQKEP
jgi:DNA-binding transcriptional LysR family regulator